GGQSPTVAAEGQDGQPPAPGGRLEVAAQGLDLLAGRRVAQTDEEAAGAGDLPSVRRDEDRAVNPQFFLVPAAQAFGRSEVPDFRASARAEGSRQEEVAAVGAEARADDLFPLDRGWVAVLPPLDRG